MQIEVQVSTEQVLRAAEQLSPLELEGLITQILTLRAQRAAPHVDATETDLLLAIDKGWSPVVQQRFDDLMVKRQEGRLTLEELNELVQLTDQSEQRDVQRLAALTALAALRGITLADIMDTLGITPVYA